MARCLSLTTGIYRSAGYRLWASLKFDKAREDIIAGASTASGQ